MTPVNESTKSVMTSADAFLGEARRTAEITERADFS
jgi:hypothetical protein